MNRRHARVLLSAPAALWLMGCGGHSSPKPSIEPVAVVSPDDVPGPTLAPPAAVSLVPAVLTTPGFRVELFRSSSLRDAEQFRDAAAARLERAIYVEYETPVYRVRAGDFSTHEEAEAWRGVLGDRGFERTDVVGTLVRIAP